MQPASRPTATSRRTAVDDAAFALCLAAFAAALVGATGLAVFGELESPNAASTTASGQPAPGSFTGKPVNGAPV